LRKVQKDFARFVNEGEESIGYVEMGLGKTGAWLAALKERFDEKPDMRVLIVAPRTVALSVWPSEVKKWDFSQHWRVRSAASGPWQWRREVLASPKGRIVTINCEMVPKMLETFGRQLPFDLVIIDEVDKFKNPSSLRFKKFFPAMPSFQTRLAGTGTLVSEGLDDTYGPAQLVTQGRAWPMPHTRWRQKFFYRLAGGPNGKGGRWLPQKGAEAEIMRRISPLIFRARAEDHLDLPPMVVKPYVIDMPPAMKKDYREILHHHRLRLASGSISQLEAAATQMKLRQLCSGFVYTNPEVDLGDGRDVEVKRYTEWRMKGGGPKFSALHDILEELGHEQALIMTQFVAERDQLKMPWLSGSLPASLLNARITAWNQGRIRRMSGHPRSMGHGVNLQEGGAHHIVWLSLPWSRAEYDQANARLQRMGQTSTVFCHILMMRGSVDEAIFEALRHKADVRTAVDRYLREG